MVADFMADFMADFQNQIGRLVRRQVRRERARLDAAGAGDDDDERAAAVAGARELVHHLFRAAAAGAASGEALQYASPGTSADEPAVLVLSWSWGEPRFDRALEFHFHPADGTVAWRIVAGAGPSGLQHVEPDLVDEELVRDAVQRLVAHRLA